MACLYAGKEYASVEERNSYLQGLKPLKYEDLQESFEGFPAASSDDAFCKVTLLYASELYARKGLHL